jgi:hypothetical protein
VFFCHSSWWSLCSSDFFGAVMLMKSLWVCFFNGVFVFPLTGRGDLQSGSISVAASSCQFWVVFRWDRELILSDFNFGGLISSYFLTRALVLRYHSTYLLP